MLAMLAVTTSANRPIVISVGRSPRSHVAATGTRYAAGKKGPARVTEPMGIGTSYAMLQWSGKKPITGKGQRPRRFTDDSRAF